MSDYIKREIIADRLEKIFLLQSSTARTIAETLPASDVVERKHGKLLTNEFGYERCSVCNYGLMLFITDENNILRNPNFCPNCGAQMESDGE